MTHWKRVSKERSILIWERGGGWELEDLVNAIILLLTDKQGRYCFQSTSGARYGGYRARYLFLQGDAGI